MRLASGDRDVQQLEVRRGYVLAVAGEVVGERHRVPLSPLDPS